LLLTKGEAAERLGVSVRTIERLVAAGRLPLVHIESAARFRVSDLEAYVHDLPEGQGPNPAPTPPMTSPGWHASRRRSDTTAGPAR